MKLKEFEDMTIKQLKELTKQFKEQNPDTPTAEELLENLRKELNKNDWK